MLKKFKRKEAEKLMSKTKETHLWFVHGEDEVQIESYFKELNKAVLKLHHDEPNAVFIIDSDETGFLRAAVKKENITFRILKSLSEETKRTLSENGKRNIKNLKNQMKGH